MALGKLYFSEGCCISNVMLRNYSKIMHPTEAIKTDGIVRWKREEERLVLC